MLLLEDGSFVYTSPELSVESGTIVFALIVLYPVGKPKGP